MSKVSDGYDDTLMTTKEDWAYQRIKEDILNNKFKPGSVMVERKLAEQYNVSRSPIRHALKRLVNEGFLSNETGVGIMVPVYTLEDVLQVYDLLEVLQIYAVKVSLKNYDQIADTELSYIVGEIRKANDQKDLVSRMDWDVKFHTYIINLVGNKRLDMIFKMIIDQKRRFDITSYEDFEHGRLTTEQHEAIYNALIKRDMDAAIEAIRAHTKYIKKYYIDKLIMDRYNV